VDRSALPPPEQVQATHIALPLPVTGLELAISDICQRVLNRQVAPADKFFDLGGDSLQLIEVHSELQKRLAREATLMDLFEFTTVRTLADHLGDLPEPEPAFSAAQGRARKQKEAYSRQKPSKVGS
jgi:acyl carrier protein